MRAASTTIYIVAINMQMKGCVGHACETSHFSVFLPKPGGARFGSYFGSSVSSSCRVPCPCTPPMVVPDRILSAFVARETNKEYIIYGLNYSLKSNFSSPRTPVSGVPTKAVVPYSYSATPVPRDPQHRHSTLE